MGDWQALAAAHRAKQNESIPAEWRLDKNLLAEISGEGTDDAGRLVRSQAVKKSRLLTEKELEITDNFTATQLLDKIARRELTSLEVATAFCKRAALAQQLTSCLTEIFFDEGIEHAKWLDKYLQEEGHVVGRLHGLPISLKDSFIVKGQHATVGYVEALRRPLLDDTSTLVDMLLDAGAIIYCKTNVPQTMMTADSENNLFGRTLNPHNTKLTAGGSTGGEGALLAFKGSPLGVGTDIAGSIRIPSLCCGIYGFKPTAERVPFSGNTRGPFPRLRIPGGVIPAAGPMGNSVEDLELFMRVITDMRPWKYDATVHDVPWRRQETAGGKVLTIGVLPEDETYRLQPPVRRALDSAVEALARAGHKIVHLPRDDSRSVALGAVLGFYCFGLGGPPLDNLEEEFKEPLIPSVKRGVHPFGSASFSIPQDLDFPQLLDRITGARSEYSDSWKRTWITHDLDVIIGPGAQHTAVPHDTYGNPVYTLVWNVLDYPAGIIPYEEVRKEHDPHHVKATAPFDPHYDPEELHGAPCALQIVTPRFRDEECLSAMRIIDEVLHRKQ